MKELVARIMRQVRGMISARLEVLESRIPREKILAPSPHHEKGWRYADDVPYGGEAKVGSAGGHQDRKRA